MDAIKVALDVHRTEVAQEPRERVERIELGHDEQDRREQHVHALQVLDVGRRSLPCARPWDNAPHPGLGGWAWTNTNLRTRGRTGALGVGVQHAHELVFGDAFLKVHIGSERAEPVVAFCAAESTIARTRVSPFLFALVGAGRGSVRT